MDTKEYSANYRQMLSCTKSYTELKEVKAVRKNYLKILLSVLSGACMTGYAIAAPEIHSANITKSGDYISITIEGQGFGKKASAHPILWVFGDDVRLRGERSSLEKGAVIGERVPIGLGPESSIWDKGYAPVFDDRTRHSGLSHSYLSKVNGWVGWPYVFGGREPNASDRAFISWRLKPWGQINKYRAVAYTNLSGEFDLGESPFHEGELVKIFGSEEFTANVVWIDTTESIVHLKASGMSSKDYIGAQMKGQKSGASLILRPDITQLTASPSKFLRTYDSLEKGVRTVFVTNRWFGQLMDDQGNRVKRVFESDGGAGYGVPRVTDRLDWNFIEVYIDNAGEIGEGYVDVNRQGRKWYRDLNLTSVDLSDVGTTIANIGWEAARTPINTALNFGEIYFDKTPQRIIISGSTNHDAISHNAELQFPLEWSNERVAFELNIGELDISGDNYIYIYDGYNDANPSGFKICLSCYMSQPSIIELKVE